MQVVLLLAIWAALAALAGLLTTLAAAFVTGGHLSDAGRGVARPVSATDPTLLAISATTAVGTVVAVRVTRRFVGGPALLDLGLRPHRGWLAQIALGIALGPVMFLAMLLALLGASWATVDRGAIDAAGLLVACGTFTFAAFSEEVVARGWVLQVLARRFGTSVGVVGSASIFAALHALNPDFTATALLGLFLAGLLLAQAYVATRRLWLPIALHLSWNVSEGPLFGFPVSGFPSDGLLRITMTGPDAVTGGLFGPEAGLVCVVGIALASGVVYALTRARVGWLRA